MTKSGSGSSSSQGVIQNVILGVGHYYGKNTCRGGSKNSGGGKKYRVGSSKISELGLANRGGSYFVCLVSP